MDASLAPVARSSTFPAVLGPKKSNTLFSVFSRGTDNQVSKTWKPPALRAPVLILTTAICWSLITVLQFLLHKSQNQNGIIFAPRINDLPLRQTFLYLYFPTIVAVLFSIYWAWIDLETKRMEPYYQLSKENGALGKDSLLLHYPFDFLPLVPLKAARDRHWPVFWASFAVVLVTWGLVPTQAGIFTVKTVTRATNTTFDISTFNIPVEQQVSNLTLRYSQSTYGIVSLNETLPPYMARNYTLAPFRISTGGNVLDDTPQGQGTWTAPTVMYSLDLYCENASHKADGSRKIFYVSNSGCNFTLGPTGNLTVGEDIGYGTEALSIKQYVGQYAGYWNHGGYADYSLDRYCPETVNHTFFAAFSKSKAKKEDPPNDVTAIFCTPTYYQQLVSATVDTINRSPLKVHPLGDKILLAPDVFNSSTFEQLLNELSLGYEVRGDNLPAKSAPRYLEPIAKTNLSLTSGSGGLTQAMVALSVGVGDLPLEDYLDWKTLSGSYADAYRLSFARAMVDVLGTEFQSSQNTTGEVRMTTEAVVLEPVFVYIVEGFLGVVSVTTLALLYLTCTRIRKLRTDPNTIASIMAIVSDNQHLLAEFSELDCCTVDDVRDAVGHKRYKLVYDGASNSIVEIDQNDAVDYTDSHPGSLGVRRNTNIAKPVRPLEFSLWVAGPFINLFIILSIALGVIYAKANVNGLPLPSANSLVQNILENYIPTAIATMIEPMWVLINRLLCMLQPLEELQGCNAKANKSIDLNYNSLPPQLVIFRALMSRHFVLAAVCSMALLANLLAISLSGLFNQATIDMRHSTRFNPPYELKFVPINGSIGPVSGLSFGSLNFSGAYRGGNGEDQFLVAESNYTRGTPLPPWTDESMFYLPLFEENTDNPTAHANGSGYEAVTQAFGADLDCTRLEIGDRFEAAVVTEKSGLTFSSHASINLTVPADSGDVRCSSLASLPIRPGPIRENSICVNGPSALELVVQLQASGGINATQEETDACMRPVVLGWVRDPQGSCPIGKSVQLNENNSIFIRCQPRLMVGTAKVRVDPHGRLQHKAELIGKVNIDDQRSPREQFSNEPINLIGQSSRYLFKFDGAEWHNDTFADDFVNYFIRRASNSTRLIDPAQSTPSFEEILDPLKKSYAKLFAIWLGTNKDNLLIRRTNDDANSIDAWRVQPEQRLFVSTPMFAIAEAILCTYAIIAFIVYMRRPGQYLARLPTSIAAVIALFAASAAVLDMKDTSHLDARGRSRHLQDIDARYGYGSYVGADGRVHIGIEKTPFVKVRSKSTWFEKKLPLFRKTSAGC